jgi:hypothetical protein
LTLEFPIDRYDFKARLQPAILMVAPVAVVVAVWLPQAQTWIGGASLTLLAGAVASLLMSWVRMRGRRIQTLLENQLGGLPSTIILRHGDPHISSATRKRMHDALRSKGLRVPTEQQQRTDPVAADEAYRSCVDWLLERTRSDRLLKLENIEFGFRRNLLGIRKPAIAVVTACLLFDLTVLLLHPVNSTQLSAGAALAAALLAAGTLWFTIVNIRFVEDASWGYARRLVGAIETL